MRQREILVNSEMYLAIVDDNGYWRVIVLFSQPSVKWAVSQMGLIESHMRLPLTDHDPQYHEAMCAALATAGVVLEAAAARI